MAITLRPDSSNLIIIEIHAKKWIVQNLNSTLLDLLSSLAINKLQECQSQGKQIHEFSFKHKKDGLYVTFNGPSGVKIKEKCHLGPLPFSKLKAIQLEEKVTFRLRQEAPNSSTNPQDLLSLLLVGNISRLQWLENSVNCEEIVSDFLKANKKSENPLSNESLYLLACRFTGQQMHKLGTKFARAIPKDQALLFENLKKSSNFLSHILFTAKDLDAAFLYKKFYTPPESRFFGLIFQTIAEKEIPLSAKLTLFKKFKTLSSDQPIIFQDELFPDHKGVKRFVSSGFFFENLYHFEKDKREGNPSFSFEDMCRILKTEIGLLFEVRNGDSPLVNIASSLYQHPDKIEILHTLRRVWPEWLSQRNKNNESVVQSYFAFLRQSPEDVVEILKFFNEPIHPREANSNGIPLGMLYLANVNLSLRDVTLKECWDFKEIFEEETYNDFIQFLVDIPDKSSPAFIDVSAKLLYQLCLKKRFTDKLFSVFPLVVDGQLQKPLLTSFLAYFKPLDKPICHCLQESIEALVLPHNEHWQLLDIFLYCQPHNVKIQTSELLSLLSNKLRFEKPVYDKQTVFQHLENKKELTTRSTLKINVFKKNLQNPLHVAIIQGQLQNTHFLIEEYKKDYPHFIDLPDMSGCTPLYYAASHGHSDIFIRLLQEGAQLNNKILSQMFINVPILDEYLKSGTPQQLEALKACIAQNPACLHSSSIIPQETLKLLADKDLLPRPTPFLIGVFQQTLLSEDFVYSNFLIELADSKVKWGDTFFEKVFSEKLSAASLTYLFEKFNKEMNSKYPIFINSKIPQGLIEVWHARLKKSQRFDFHKLLIKRICEILKALPLFFDTGTRASKDKTLPPLPTPLLSFPPAMSHPGLAPILFPSPLPPPTPLKRKLDDPSAEQSIAKKARNETLAEAEASLPPVPKNAIAVILKQIISTPTLDDYKQLLQILKTVQIQTDAYLIACLVENKIPLNSWQTIIAAISKSYYHISKKRESNPQSLYHLVDTFSGKVNPNISFNENTATYFADLILSAKTLSQISYVMNAMQTCPNPDDIGFTLPISEKLDKAESIKNYFAPDLSDEEKLRIIKYISITRARKGIALLVHCIKHEFDREIIQNMLNALSRLNITLPPRKVKRILLLATELWYHDLLIKNEAVKALWSCTHDPDHEMIKSFLLYELKNHIKTSHVYTEQENNYILTLIRTLSHYHLKSDEQQIAPKLLEYTQAYIDQLGIMPDPKEKQHAIQLVIALHRYDLPEILEYVMTVIQSHLWSSSFDQHYQENRKDHSGLWHLFLTPDEGIHFNKDSMQRRIQLKRVMLQWEHLKDDADRIYAAFLSQENQYPELVELKKRFQGLENGTRFVGIEEICYDADGILLRGLRPRKGEALYQASLIDTILGGCVGVDTTHMEGDFDNASWCKIGHTFCTQSIETASSYSGQKERQGGHLILIDPSYIQKKLDNADARSEFEGGSLNPVSYQGIDKRAIIKVFLDNQFKRDIELLHGQTSLRELLGSFENPCFNQLTLSELKLLRYQLREQLPVIENGQDTGLKQNYFYRFTFTDLANTDLKKAIQKEGFKNLSLDAICASTIKRAIALQLLNDMDQSKAALAEDFNRVLGEVFDEECDIT